MNHIQYLVNGPSDAPCTMILAHGAGAPMDSPFMNGFAEGLAEKKESIGGIQVVRFEFPYMAERRVTGKKRPPNGQKILLEAWDSVLQDFKDVQNIVIGGKSMGGRMASMVAAESVSSQPSIKGLLCLGYPFHPPGKPEKTRVEHLKNLQMPTLILQGERDTLGNLEEVKQYNLSKSITINWLKDGDHSFKPRKLSGTSEAANIEIAIQKTFQFITKLL